MALDLEIAGSVIELDGTEEAPRARPQALRRIRDTHHALARALARNQSVPEASLATGYSPYTIALLKRDPSFLELIEHYKRTDNEAKVDVEARILGLSLDFMQELQERLSADPESFSNEEISDNMKLLIDRAGYAPVTRSFNVHGSVGIGAELDRLKRKREANE